MTRISRLATQAAAAALLAGLALGVSMPCRAQDAAKLYVANCAGCHGPRGKGNGPSAGVLIPPPGDFSQTLRGRSDQWIAHVIEKGGAGSHMVAVMPAYGGLLTKAQVDELVAYIKELK